MPTRYNSILNDPTVEWDDRLYKSIIVLCIRIMYHDESPTPLIDLELLKEYLTAIERTVGDIDRVFLLLDELLLFGKVNPESVFVGKDDAPTSEIEILRLGLVTTLIGVTSQTETLRNAVTNVYQGIKEAYSTLAQDNTKADEALNKVLTKIRAGRKEVNEAPPMYVQRKTGEGPQKSKKERLADLMQKEVAARQVRSAKLAKNKATLDFKLRRFIPRTIPLGTDHFGNTYWHFQQRSLDSKEWGWWIVVEKSTVMPNSFQVPAKKEKEAEAEADTDGQSSGKLQTKRKKVDHVPGTGEIYYFPIETSELDKVVPWLEYQEQLFQSFKAGARKHKLLYSDSDAERTCTAVIRYLKQLYNFCKDEQSI